MIAILLLHLLKWEDREFDDILALKAKLLTGVELFTILSHVINPTSIILVINTTVISTTNIFQTPKSIRPFVPYYMLQNTNNLKG